MQNRKEPQKILITGASGLLGHYLVAQLLNQGADVTACYHTTQPPDLTIAGLFKRCPDAKALTNGVTGTLSWLKLDLQDPVLLSETLSGYEVIIHAAAVVSFNPADYDAMYQTNILATRLLVDILIQQSAKTRLIYISSVAALGKPLQEGPLAGWTTAESQWDPDYPHSRYGVTKFGGEAEVWRGVQEGLKAIIVNPALVLAFGNGRSSSSLFDYVIKEKPFYTNGTLNYVDALDLAKIVGWATSVDDGPALNKRYVVSAGQTTYKQFFEAVARQLGKTSPQWELKPWMAHLAWRIEWLRTFLIGGKPIITKETARTAFRQSKFDGSVIVATSGLTYTPLDQSVNRIAAQYASNLTKG